MTRDGLTRGGALASLNALKSGEAKIVRDGMEQIWPPPDDIEVKRIWFWHTHRYQIAGWQVVALDNIGTDWRDVLRGVFLRTARRFKL